jgi:hypothetical protein
MSIPVALGPRLTSTGTGEGSFTGASGAGEGFEADVPKVLVPVGGGTGAGVLEPPPPQAARNKDNKSMGPKRHTQVCASVVLETRYPQPSCNCPLTIAVLGPGT